MGNKQSFISESQMADYTGLTYLQEHEVLRLHQKLVKSGQTGLPTLTLEQFCSLPDFCNNPYAPRIFHIMADGKPYLDFDDCVSLYSLLSPRATLTVKSSYAFNLNDFDGDGKIGRDDVAKTITMMTSENALSKNQMQSVIDNVMRELDLDRDGYVGRGEFAMGMEKIANFMSSYIVFL